MIQGNSWEERIEHALGGVPDCPYFALELELFFQNHAPNTHKYFGRSGCQGCRLWPLKHWLMRETVRGNPSGHGTFGRHAHWQPNDVWRSIQLGRSFRIHQMWKSPACVILHFGGCFTQCSPECVVFALGLTTDAIYDSKYIPWDRSGSRRGTPSNHTTRQANDSF